MKTFSRRDGESPYPPKVATLVFLTTPTEILLIRKGRKYGAGKLNGVGGMQEPGETLRAAAERECFEEIGVHPLLPKDPIGILKCTQTGHAQAMTVCVFVAGSWLGQPYKKTECPLWVPIKELDFSKHMAGDHLWFPAMLARRPFEARLTLDEAGQLSGYQIFLF